VFGSEILEVAVGMGFLYLLLSLLCSVITEAIARIFAMRSGTLRSGIRNLLSDPEGDGLAKEFYEHPLIKGLYRQSWFDRTAKRGGKPSYISPNVFALALFDTVAPANPKLKQKASDDLRSRVLGIGNDDLKRALLVCVDDADGDLDRARANVESWFEEAMERVGGWYKRKMQLIILAVAAAVSVALNVDSFNVANALWNDAALRDSVIAAAQRDTGEPLGSDLSMIEERLGGLGLPLGWGPLPQDPIAWVVKVAGLLFTTIALSLGAPFWFDLLNRFVGVGSSGRSPNMPAAPEQRRIRPTE
jgi:hypothetical protein